jgi:signal transduction histidine kinase
LPRRFDHRIIFASAVFLLVVCGLVLSWLIYQIYAGEQWVRHTYAVQVLIAEIESDLSRSGRSRQLYLRSGDKLELDTIAQARSEVVKDLGELKRMVGDNGDQEKSVDSLEQAINGRFRTFDDSLRLADAGASSPEAQDSYNAQLVAWAQQTSSITTGMKDAESNLLERRLLHADSLFLWIIAILAITYLLALYMLWEHYRGLTFELAERKAAQRYASNLSSQLMRAQDQERRKIARDLHDGLGQSLVGAKMIADSLVKRFPDETKLADLRALLEDSVASTRSISHLLHPPLVDELGFVSAARSYVQGFADRTGIAFDIDIPDSEKRLPRGLELTLLRILQEALSNIQRHSKSTKAGVRFQANSKTATLKVWDNGVGLPPGMVQNLNGGGVSEGVGLAGMRERVRERNGQFEIHSNSRGTAVAATLPIVPESSVSSAAQS